MSAFAEIVGQGAGAAQDRRHLGGGRDSFRQLCRGKALAVFGQPLLGERDERDHALVGFARRFAEGEDAVLVEDQALDLWVLVEGARGEPRQAEAGPRIGHEAEAAAEDLGAKRFAVGLVDNAQHGAGVGVVDEGRRHEGVQQHLDRGHRAERIEAQALLHAHEIVVAQRFVRAQGQQGVEPHRRKAGGFDDPHVPAGAFDIEDVGLVAGEIARLVLSARCCRHRAAPVWGRGRAGGSYRRASLAPAECPSGAYSSMRCCASRSTQADFILVVRFRHLHPVAASSRANVGSK